MPPLNLLWCVIEPSSSDASHVSTEKYSLYTKILLDIHYVVKPLCDKWVPVTTACRVHRLLMEERPPIRRVAANVLISSHRQLTRGGPPAWGSGEVLTIPRCTNVSCYELFTKKASDLDWYFGTTKPMEECRLRVFENRVLRRIFGPNRDEVNRGVQKIT